MDTVRASLNLRKKIEKLRKKSRKKQKFMQRENSETKLKVFHFGFSINTAFSL